MIAATVHRLPGDREPLGNLSYLNAIHDLQHSPVSLLYVPL